MPQKSNHKTDAEPAEPDVLEFLQEQTAQGVIDSKGMFTIDGKRAQRKLAEFQMATPESWVLVLVQAAHRGGAQKITVTQLPRETTFTIIGARSWSWPELEAVLEGQMTTDADLFSLAVAARALSGNPNLRQFRVKAPDGTIGRWTGEAFEPRPQRFEDSPSVGQAVFEVSHQGKFEPSPYWFLEPRATAREELAAINLALTRDCFASAVPIVCDGRRVAGLHLGEPPPAHHTRAPLALVPVVSENIPSMNFRAAMEWQASSVGGISLTIGGQPELSKNPLPALIMISASLVKPLKKVTLGQAQSALLWVQDGVVIERQRLPLDGSLGLTIAASAAGLRTDLSGLRLVRDRQFDDRLRLLSRSVVEALERTWKQTQGEGVKVSTSKETTRSLFFMLGSFFTGARSSLDQKSLTSPQQIEVSRWHSTFQDELRTLPQRTLAAFPSPS